MYYMKNRKRKGFTIVELVIVIAIVAVLAAVLVPTFADLIDKAGLSADIQTAKQLNTVLAIGSAEKKPGSLDEVLEILLEKGFDPEKHFEPTSKNCRFLWYNEDGSNLIILAELPQFFEDALSFNIGCKNNGELPEKFKAKVIFPPDSGVDGSVVRRFEDNLNKLIASLWNSEAVVDGSFIVKYGGEVKTFLEEQLGNDEELRSVLSIMLDNDLANGKENHDNPDEIIDLQSISLTPSELKLAVEGEGKRAQINVTYYPATANANKGITWDSEDNSVAIVDQSGNVTAVARGTTRIIATSQADESIKAFCNVTVGDTSAASVTINTDILFIAEGVEKDIPYTHISSDATNANLTWSVESGSDFVTVDRTSGKIIGEGVGVATVKVAAEDNGELFDTVTIVVFNVIPETNENFVPTISVGGKYKYNVTVEAPTGYSADVKYVSKTENVNISSEGIASGVKAGDGEVLMQITCDENPVLEVSYNLRVVADTGKMIFVPDSENFKKDEHYIYANTVAAVSAMITDEAGNLIEIENCTWSENSDKFEIVGKTSGSAVTIKTAEGVSGTASLKATIEDKEYVFDFVIVSPLVDGDVTVTPKTLTLIVGKSGNITYTNENATSFIDNVEWEIPDSSEKDIISVDKDADTVTVTGNKVSDENGVELLIKFTDVMGGEPVVVSVTVKVISSMDKVTFTEVPILIEKEMEGNISSEGTISYQHVGKSVLVWTSSDETVVTVNEGYVTAISAGTATISVSAADNPDVKLAECTIIVYGIDIVCDKMEIIPNEQIELTATVLPALPEGATIEWKRSNGDAVKIVGAKNELICTLEGQNENTSSSVSIYVRCDTFEIKMTVKIKVVASDSTES